MKTLTAKQVDRLINDEFNRRCSGVQIDIMDSGRIFAAGRDAYKRALGLHGHARASAPEDIAQYVGAAIAAFVETIRKN